MSAARSANVISAGITEAPSTITMQLAGNLFLDRSDRQRAPQAARNSAALQLERRYTKAANIHDVCEPSFLLHGN